MGTTRGNLELHNPREERPATTRGRDGYRGNLTPPATRTDGFARCRCGDGLRPHAETVAARQQATTA
jgi:hypothetical protein